MSAEFDTMSAMEMRRRIAAKEISPVDVTKQACQGRGHAGDAERLLSSDA